MKLGLAETFSTCHYLLRVSGVASGRALVQTVHCTHNVLRHWLESSVFSLTTKQDHVQSMITYHLFEKIDIDAM